MVRAGSGHPAGPTTLAGTPATVVSGGTSFSTTLPEAMRQQLLPIPAASEFTVAVLECTPTEVHFRSLPTAAMAMFGRACDGVAVSDLVGAAFIFSGKNPADEDEVIRRTSGRRDANRQPYPIPPSNYEKIRSEPARPLLNRAYFIVRVPSDPALPRLGRRRPSARRAHCRGSSDAGGTYGGSLSKAITIDSGSTRFRVQRVGVTHVRLRSSSAHGEVIYRAACH